MRRLFAAAFVLIGFTGPLAAAPPDDQSSCPAVDREIVGSAEKDQPTCGTFTFTRPTSVEHYPPQETRLVVLPTARSLKRGHGYAGVSEIFVPFFQVGVTDRFSIGAGKPLVFAAGFNPVWITPKLQVITSDSVQAAVGVIHMTGLGRGHDAGIAYGVTTIGEPDRSASIGIGYGYTGGGGRATILMMGGELRTGRNIKLITDNWLGAGGLSFVSGGVRVFRGRMSADLAMVMPIGGTVPLPLFNVAWRF